MPSLMPSLIKYFTIVGGLLFAGLIGMNAVMEPGGPGPRLVKNTPKVVVQIDPQASQVERLRVEEAALQDGERAKPQAHPVVVTEPLRIPPEPTTQPAEQPSQLVANPAQATQPMQSASATLTAAEEPARPVPAVQEETRQKVAAEKARRKRVARERARARAMQEASAARQQEQTYYSYAPRPAYGPFRQAQGGFGGAWGGGWGSWEQPEIPLP